MIIAILIAAYVTQDGNRTGSRIQLLAVYLVLALAFLYA